MANNVTAVTRHASPPPSSADHHRDRGPSPNRPEMRRRDALARLNQAPVPRSMEFPRIPAGRLTRGLRITPAIAALIPLKPEESA